MKTTINYIAVSCAAFLLLLSCNRNPQSAAGSNTKPEENIEENTQDVVISEAQMKTVNIQLGKIELKDLDRSIRVNGQMDLDPQKKAEVTSLIGGVIKQILVIEGKSVKTGQTLAYLENTQIVELQKNYLVTEKESYTAGLEFNRQKELSAEGAGTEKALQQATANYEISKAGLIGLEKQLRQLSIDPQQVLAGNIVTQIPIKSPIDGIIQKISVSIGSYVDVSTALMKVADNSQVHCDVRVFEKDIDLIKIGQEVYLSLTNQPGISVKGVIYEINQSFENDTKSIIVHVHILKNGEKRFLPGMYVTGLINVSNQKADAVPDEAIVSSDGKKYIFALEKEENDTEKGKILHFKRVEVITGISKVGYTQITPVNKLDKNAVIIKSNAFYVNNTDHNEPEE